MAELDKSAWPKPALSSNTSSISPSQASDKLDNASNQPTDHMKPISQPNLADGSTISRHGDQTNHKASVINTTTARWPSDEPEESGASSMVYLGGGVGWSPRF